MTDELLMVCGEIAKDGKAAAEEMLRLRQENAQLQATIAALRRRLAAADEDAKENARGAATEAYWQGQQGEDYGSY